MPIAALRLRPRLIRGLRYLAAAVCALLALASVLQGRRGASAAGQVTVLVARHDLPAGHALRPSDVRTTHWPKSLRPDGVITSTSALRASRLAGPMRRGEPLTVSRLIGNDLLTGLAPGTVEVTISLTDPVAAAVVHAGDRVDVLAGAASWTTDDGAGATDNSSPTSAAVVAHHLLVLAVLPTDYTRTSVSDRGASLLLAAQPSTATRLLKADRGNGFTVLGLPP